MFSKIKNLTLFNLPKHILFDLTVIIILYIFGFSNFITRDLFIDTPPSGGDLGSHYWPYFVLLRESLPHWQITNWNPGNLFGEPHLVHYFPIPFLIMALISKLGVPICVSFKLGTLLPILLLPLSVYFTLKLISFTWPTPVIGLVFSLSLLFDPGQSIWGGNAKSVYSGQFCHLYSFVFFVIWLGFLNYEWKHRKLPIWSSLLTAAIAGSHAYTFLFLPFYLIAFFFFYFKKNMKSLIKYILLSFSTGTMLSLIFLIPMIQNSKWTTPYALTWKFKSLSQEIFNSNYILCFFLFPFSLIYLGLEGKASAKTVRIIKVTLIPITIAFLLFFIFPYLGLVDVRVIPISQLTFLILISILLGYCFDKLKINPTNYLDIKKKYYYLVLLIICQFYLVWPNLYLPAEWGTYANEGWILKPLWSNVEKLSEHIKGTFSDPRVIFEHNYDINKNAGSTRVFEMLPYFAQRATLESVYMQSTIMSYVTFYTQALVSEKPSCPFTEIPCPKLDIKNTEEKLKLLGVNQLILSSKAAMTQADTTSFLVAEKEFGPWKVFKTEQIIPLVEIINRPISLIKDRNWKNVFFEWYIKYPKVDSFLVPKIYSENFDFEKVTDHKNNCYPTVEVFFGKIALKTDCPNAPHIIKFAFHENWISNHEEKLYPISPGFILIYPKTILTQLTFSTPITWKLAYIVTIVIFVFLLSIQISKKLKNKFEKYIYKTND